MIQVHGNKIACVPLFDPDKTASGLLYVPDIAKERCDQGIVKYIGSKVEWVKPGDHILFSGYTGTLVSIEGEGLVIIVPEDFVNAKIFSPDHDVPGLYFRDQDGSYFTATYEMAVELMARAREQTDGFKNMSALDRTGRKHKIYTTKPKPEEYERMR